MAALRGIVVIGVAAAHADAISVDNAAVGGGSCAVMSPSNITALEENTGVTIAIPTLSKLLPLAKCVLFFYGNDNSDDGFGFCEGAGKQLRRHQWPSLSFRLTDTLQEALF